MGLKKGFKKFGKSVKKEFNKVEKPLEKKVFKPAAKKAGAAFKSVEKEAGKGFQTIKKAGEAVGKRAFELTDPNRILMYGAMALVGLYLLQNLKKA